MNVLKLIAQCIRCITTESTMMMTTTTTRPTDIMILYTISQLKLSHNLLKCSCVDSVYLALYSPNLESSAYTYRIIYLCVLATYSACISSYIHSGMTEGNDKVHSQFAIHIRRYTKHTHLYGTSCVNRLRSHIEFVNFMWLQSKIALKS